MKKRLLALLLLAAATCMTIAGAAAPATPQDMPAEPTSVGTVKVGIIDNLNTGETIWEADSSTGTPQDSPAGPSEVLERTEPIEWDILTESVARGSSAPTSFYNIAVDGCYDGSFTALQGTIYTNKYCLSNNSGYLYYRFDGSALGPATTLTIRVYDMTAGMYVTTYKTTTFGYDGYAVSRAINGLNTSHFYYLSLTNSGYGSNYPPIEGTIQINHQNAF